MEPLYTHQIIFDEAADLTPRTWRKGVQIARRQQRRERAKGFGWTNWHVNRGRMTLPLDKRQLRQASWRRAH